MTNFVNDFIAKISDINKKGTKEMIKEIIDGQNISTGVEYIPIYICDGNEDCMKVVGYENKSCDFCDKHYCDICSRNYKICDICNTRYCNICSRDIEFVDFKDGISCHLRGCPIRK